LLEEALGGCLGVFVAATGRADGNIKLKTVRVGDDAATTWLMGVIATYLSDEHDDAQDETNPGANGTENGLERNLVQGVAMELPGIAEADMGDTDL
jgi:hypothetical protein